MASIIKFGSLMMNGEVWPFPILRDGRFVLEGTEDLNIPLNSH